ncbi:hypothetical protein CHU98_g9819 [Xylaria longipes]|nr:hypothetical protein CHU98_g9819 [Xylaria longipes]
MDPEADMLGNRTAVGLQGKDQASMCLMNSTDSYGKDENEHPDDGHDTETVLVALLKRWMQAFPGAQVSRQGTTALTGRNFRKRDIGY